MEQEGRGDEWMELKADEGAEYDDHDEIDLSGLVPLIAKPTSPDNVVPVTEIEGEPIYQSYIGSSANPGYRDFAIASLIVEGRSIANGISFDINPTSRQLLQQLVENGHIANLLGSGGRMHQAGCNGCIGMGQAPATGQNSLRTTPRNFPGRSGTKEDSVFLCSPEIAAASALYGVITDPRKLDMDYPEVTEPKAIKTQEMLEAPPEDSSDIEIEKGPNISEILHFDPIEDNFELPALLKLGANIPTAEILAGGSRVLPYRSNIEKISTFAFEGVDSNYHNQAMIKMEQGGHTVVAGHNYGQGSSREHAALAPRYLRLKVVLVKSFARIHLQNLINFRILPVNIATKEDYARIEAQYTLQYNNDLQPIQADEPLEGTLKKSVHTIRASQSPTRHHKDIMLASGNINWVNKRQ